MVILLVIIFMVYTDLSFGYDDFDMLVLWTQTKFANLTRRYFFFYRPLPVKAYTKRIKVAVLEAFFPFTNSNTYSEVQILSWKNKPLFFWRTPYSVMQPWNPINHFPESNESPSWSPRRVWWECMSTQAYMVFQWSNMPYFSFLCFFLFRIHMRKMYVILERSFKWKW